MFRRLLNKFSGDARVKLYDEENPLYSDRPWQISHRPGATVDDIYYCFRLLLDRAPNAEEWAGHSSRSGEPLANVVQTYVNSGEFSDRKLQEVIIPAGIVQKHNGMFELFADENDFVLGAPALAGSYEDEVTKVLESLLEPGDSFLDVGANLGYFSLMAATIVGSSGHVYSVEPNDANVKLLESSVKANGFQNISVMQVAATDRIETLFLHSTIGNGNTSALDKDSIFSMRTVPGIPLDNLLAHRTKPIKLIKIDVERYEYKALLGATQLIEIDKPHIAFEFSGAGLVGIAGEDFLKWLADFGYDFVNIAHPNGFLVSQSISEIMADFKTANTDHIDVLAKPSILH